MATVMKKDLVDKVANGTGQQRADVANRVERFFRTVIDELGKDDRIELRGFVVFEVGRMSARGGLNPKTMRRMHVPSRRRVKFKPGRLLREAVTEPTPARSMNSAMGAVASNDTG